MGQIIKLGELEPDAVTKLLQLPASPPLGVLEQDRAKEWGGQHPCKLQLAASFLWQAGKEGYGEAWARRQFLLEAQRLPKQRAKPNLMRAITNLGKLSQGIGDQLDDFGNRITGMVIIIVVILGVLGIFHWPEVKELLNKALGG